MRRIKNSPGKYVKRSALISKSHRVEKSKPTQPVARDAGDFLAAEIDKNFYVTFRRRAEEKPS